jgi:hypothetical protein
VGEEWIRVCEKVGAFEEVYLLIKRLILGHEHTPYILTDTEGNYVEIKYNRK